METSGEAQMRIIDFGTLVQFRDKENWPLLVVRCFFPFDGPDVWEVMAPSGRVREVHKDKQSAVDAAMAYLAMKKLKGEIE